MTLVVKQLSKAFATVTEPLVVLDQVSFTMEPGDSLAIVGPSGSGKSTLLHILGTLDTPTSGSVRYAEVDPFKLASHELASFRNQTIGFVFQEHYLLPQLTVLENVLIPCMARGQVGDSDQQRANALIERVGLAGRAQHLPTELSGGERQRAAIARALVMCPKILLADEPTGNLDQRTADQVTELLLQSGPGAPEMFVLVTHNMEIATRCQRVATLREQSLYFSDG